MEEKPKKSPLDASDDPLCYTCAPWLKPLLYGVQRPIKRENPPRHSTEELVRRLRELHQEALRQLEAEQRPRAQVPPKKD